MTVGTTAAQDLAPASVSRPVDWAPVARVNLLPPEILEARGFRRVQRTLGLGVVATLLLSGGMVWWASTGVSRAQDALAAEQSVTTSLQREQARYAEVPLVLNQVEAAETARQTAMAHDLAWHTMLYDISVVTPARVWLQSVAGAVSMPGASTTAATASGPLDVTGEGTLTITGKAPAFDDVADWLDAVDTIDGLEASMLDTAVLELEPDAARKDAYVSFTTHITVTADAYTHRFDRKAS